MSHITIECPDCKIEHTAAWKTGTFCSGEFVCGCDTIIAFRVQLTARGSQRDPSREEIEASRG